MTTPLIPDAERAAFEIEHALALNPTPGPWTTISRATYHWEEEADLLDANGNDIESAEFVKPPGDVPTTRGQMYMRDAVYITKVSPDKLRLLLDERQFLIDEVAESRASRQSAQAEVESLKAEVSRLKGFEKRWKAFEAARRELLARQVATWISVEDRLPDDHVEVIGVGRGWSDAFTAAVYYDTESHSWWLSGQDASDNHAARQYPTHWMPLPPPPLPDNSAFSKPDRAPYEDGYPYG